MGELTRIFVAGEWVEGEGDLIEDKNPYNGETVALVRRASPRQMERAIEAAAEAFKAYRRMPAYKRADMLLAVSQKIAARQEELARTIALEVAKPIRTARAEVARAIYTFRIASEEARRVGGECVPMDAVPAGEGRVGYFYRQPVGVVGAITPFNFPLNLVAHKVAPALAAGNTVVVKPTEKAPLTALKLAEILEEAGFPPGTVSVVPASAEVTDILLTSPKVRKISFTGSVPVGKYIRDRVGLKKITLELGSKFSPAPTWTGRWMPPSSGPLPTPASRAFRSSAFTFTKISSRRFWAGSCPRWRPSSWGTRWLRKRT